MGQTWTAFGMSSLLFLTAPAHPISTFNHCFAYLKSMILILGLKLVAWAAYLCFRLWKRFARKQWFWRKLETIDWILRFVVVCTSILPFEVIKRKPIWRSILEQQLKGHFPHCWNVLSSAVSPFFYDFVPWDLEGVEGHLAPFIGDYTSSEHLPSKLVL